MTSSPPGNPVAPAPSWLAAQPDREHWVRWLAADLLEDAAARLEHGGGGSATTIALAKVFVDLAARAGSAGVQDEEGNDEAGEPDLEAVPPPRPGVLASLLAMAPRPATRGIGAGGGPQREESPRVLLLGGPGQGKSTLAQQLCQLHRAALLAPERDNLLPAARNALGLLLATHMTEELPVPATPCWPLRVVLRDFAAWLSHDKGEASTALLRFSVRRIRDRRSPLDAERLAAFLGAHPWLLVLDGLDEVPISGGRARMLGAVRAWLAAPWAASPHLVIATTRPQGYAGELGDFEAHALIDLSRDRAFRYASLLVEARHPNQPGRQREVLERLAQAWVEPTSRRLFRTPLQVSMMAALVAEVGPPPADRYRLFSDYYRLMYRRELERPNLAHAELLRDLQKPIDEVHRLAGFWLQARSESAGGEAALLSRDELGELIHHVLVRFGYDNAAERAQWAERIFEAALERLVLLVHAEQDRYGFEIRSLQELMAAEALATGADEIVKERVRHVAPIDAWRNVLLFVAGKWFAHAEHLGAFLVNELCPWLNDGIQDVTFRGVLTGSEIALDILNDGAARHQRQHVKPLVTLALRLLELPPAYIHRMLAYVGAREFTEPLKRALAQGLVSQNVLPAWLAVLFVADAHPWAAELAGHHWPPDGAARQRVVEVAFMVGLLWGDWIDTRIAESLADFEPMWTFERSAFGGNRSALAWLRAIPATVHQRRAWFGHTAIQAGGKPSGIEFTLVPLRAEGFLNPTLARWDTCPPRWRPWVAAARFASNPSASTLAENLHWMADQCDAKTIRSRDYGLPWPLTLALALSEGPLQLRNLAERLATGELGDTLAWERAERRWKEDPIDIEQLLKMVSVWPGNENEGLAFPLPACDLLCDREEQLGPRWLHRAVDEYRAAENPRRTTLLFLVDCLLFRLADEVNITGLLSLDELRSVLDTTHATGIYSAFWIAHLAPEGGPRETWATAVDELARHAKIDADFEAFPDALKRLLDWCAEWPDKLGLIRLLAIGLPDADPALDARSTSKVVHPLRFPAASSARFHAALISIAARPEGLDDTTLAGILSESIPEDPAEAAIAIGWLQNVASSALLAPLVPQLPRHAWRLAAAAVSGLRRHQAQHSSDLDVPATCERLRLPPPPVPEPPQPQPDAASPTSAPPWIPITSITLSNLRPFRSTVIELPAPAEGAGQWVVLVGENGVGKSTVLRALALALADGSAAAGALAKSEAPYRGEAAGPARIDVRAGDRTFLATIELDREANREGLSREPRNGGHRPFVVAYGCHRGSALGDPTRGVSFASELDIATLFDETRGLAPAESWLTKLKLGAREDPNGPAGERFRVVQQVLCEILDIRSLDVLADGVWVDSVATGRARLAALSDGYLTTAGWVVDLLARWLDRAQRLGHEVTSNFHQTMEGLVLLDEVDLHLHPRWQRRVLQDLKRLFPRLSFVVTTHQPLTLLGADPGEIFVLRRDDEQGTIDVRQIDLDRGLRTDQVLTGEWFGLSTTLDPDTLKLLDEHRQLLRRGVPEEDPGRKALEAVLRDRLGGFADTSVERLVQSVTAEILEEASEKMPPQEKEQARERIARVARERLLQRSKATDTGS